MATVVTTNSSWFSNACAYFAALSTASFVLCPQRFDEFRMLVVGVEGRLRFLDIEAKLVGYLIDGSALSTDEFA